MFLEILKTDKRNLDSIRAWMESVGSVRASMFVDSEGEVKGSAQFSCRDAEISAIYIENFDQNGHVGLMVPPLTAICHVFLKHLERDSAMLHIIRMTGGEIRLCSRKMLEVIPNSAANLQYERRLS